MVIAGAGPPNSDLWPQRWGVRDWIACIGLFAATGGVVLWQNAHVAVLFDLSYILNTAARIAVGQVPYRDFPLAHAPLTFLLQAAIVRLTGRVYFHHVLYVAAVGGLGTVLTWRIALNLLRERVAKAWTVALLLALPLTFVGIYCILPNPEYDCDCGFWILVAVWGMQRIDILSRPSLPNRETVQQSHCHPERSLPRVLRQTKSKDLRLSFDRFRIHRSGDKNKIVAKIAQSNRNLLRGFLAGVALVVPVFFKQNMGLPFLLACVVAILAMLAARRPRRQQPSRPDATALMAVLAGACAGLLAGALVLRLTAGVGNYIHWTIAYAGQRRLPGLNAMLGVYWYPSLAWMLACVVAGLIVLRGGFGKKLWLHVAAFLLLASPFLFALVSLLLYDDADERGDSLLAIWPVVLVLSAALLAANLIRQRRQLTLRIFLPLILLAAVHGTLMSQQLWGSTYGIWPLLILLLAELFAFLDRFVPRRFAFALVAVVSTAMLVCGALYTTSEERLSYAQFPDSPPQHSAFPALAGMATPGPYIPEFDELLRYTQANIPFDDGILLLPGEEPFYFATGRAPRFPVPFFDPTIDPYSPAEIAAMARSRNIRWLIVKTDLQLKEDPTPDRAATMDLLMRDYALAARLRGYDVYRANTVE
jgi:hypothetical protein